MEYYVLAFYIFTPIDNPHEEIAKQKAFCAHRDMKGRIYISEEGINGQLSGAKEDALAYINLLKSDERFSDVEFKIHIDTCNVFAKMTIKYRKQIVAMDEKADMSKVGTHLSPEEWDKMLDEKDEDTMVIDVRNDYEWKVGHFEGAELPELETFRKFPKYARDLKEKRDPKKTKVMMYCTGGIRCELYSALMKNEGFENVFQLQGGVIKYGLNKRAKYWKGKLFVFDDRMVIPISEENSETISHCQYCDEKADHYYNCANMDCNDLIMACPGCFEENLGCCSDGCKKGRVRPLGESDKKTPFRKLPFEKKQALRGAL